LAIANPYFDAQEVDAAESAGPLEDRTASRDAAAPLVIHNPFMPPAVEFDGGPVLQTATREW
jgi:hypothetical protein